MMAIKSLPVTVLSGFLGAGKTTLLNHILDNQDGPPGGALSSSNVNTDTALVSGDYTGVSRTEETLVEMSRRRVSSRSIPN